MPHLDPGWRSAVALAVLLGLAAVLLRRRERTSLALRESSLAMVLYACWCLIGLITLPHVAGAESRGRDLFHLEQWLHLPSEVSVQHVVLPHAWLAHAVNAYYLYGHLNVMVVLLVWTWLRHRSAYSALRLQLVLLTVVCMLVQLVTVAPPRLLPDLGFVDLANRYGESVYGILGGGLSGQLLAMPSLHVGWAALVAWTVWRYGSGPLRGVGVAHLVLMTLVVVASANHWWMDGIVAVALLGLVIALVDRLPLRNRQADEPDLVPVLAASA